MGIKGLWQALKPYVRDGHLSQFRSQRVAVDMYVWLHRAVLGCVEVDMACLMDYLHRKYPLEGSGGRGLVGAETAPTTSTSCNDPSALASTGSSAAVAHPSPEELLAVGDTYIDFIVKKVECLQRFGVVPVCVFDGAAMPMKRETDRERQERRRVHFETGLQLLEELYLTHGEVRPHSPAYREALQELEKALDISTELAHTVIQVLKEEHQVECIVAPYEADAELAYLCRQGYVQAVISEDSDLIAYYCPCIIAKLDTSAGRCEVLQPPSSVPRFFADLAASAAARHRPAGDVASSVGGGGSTTTAVHGTGAGTSQSGGAGSPPSSPLPPTTVGSSFSYESFLLGCIMAGCDYVENLRHIGIKTAMRLVAHTVSLPQLLDTLQAQYGFPPEEVRVYRGHVLSAFYCFAHHVVYCPTQRKLIPFFPLPPPPASANGCAVSAPRLKKELVGELWPTEVAQKVCEECLLDPCTLRLYTGLYQPCVERYLRRTRRGQTSLRAFSGFEKFDTAKVVLRAVKQEGDGETVGQHSGGLQSAVPMKRRRVGGPWDEEGEDAEADFGGPLRKVRCTSGFVGARGAGTQRVGLSRVVVRSKYFVRAQPQGVEDWSAESSEPSNNETQEKENEAPTAAVAPRERAACGADSARHRTDALTDANTAAQAGDCTLSGAHVASESSSTTSVTGSSSGSSGCATALDGVSEATLSLKHTTSADYKEGVEGGSGSSSSEEPFSPPPGLSVASVHSLAVKGALLGVEEDGEEEGREAELIGSGEDATGHDATQRSDPCPSTHASHDSATAVGSTAMASAKDESQSQATGTGERRCACPFGYWQCDRAHSIFEQCFLGKSWVRGVRPSPLSSESSSPPPPSSSPSPRSAQAQWVSSDHACGPTTSLTSGKEGLPPAPQLTSRYTAAAFRPPRPLHTAADVSASTALRSAMTSKRAEDAKRSATPTPPPCATAPSSSPCEETGSRKVPTVSRRAEGSSGPSDPADVFAQLSFSKRPTATSRRR